MGFFDDAVSAAKTVGKTVSKRTEEILIISKKKLDAIELENKLSNYYEDLGKIYFSILSENSEEKDDTAENQTELVKDIAKVLADIKDLRADIDAMSKNK